MSIFRLNEKYLKPVVLGATGLFLCLAAAYFIPAADLPHKISYPLAALTAASLWLCP